MSNQTQVRSWRAGPSVDENSPITRWTGIALLAAILVGGIAIFIWFLPPPPREEMFFSALVVESYDNFIPPLRGTHEDVEDLKQTDVKDRLPYSWVDVRELQSEKTISMIRPELQKALESSEQHDVVFIYVAAHGIGRDNEAFLLGSDYTGEGDDGLCNVNDVLDAVKTLPCKTKVIFFDCGHLNSDARLGVLVNSFPYCLQQQMENLQDDSVWAISSTQLLQVSNFTNRDFKFKSVFGQAVLSGINRQADTATAETTDDLLTLAELYEHIARSCYTQTKSHPQILQTPVLLQGGKSVGDIAAAEKVGLGKFLPRVDESAEDNPDEAAEENGESKKTARAKSVPRPQKTLLALASHWSPSTLSMQNPQPPSESTPSESTPSESTPSESTPSDSATGSKEDDTTPIANSDDPAANPNPAPANPTSADPTGGDIEPPPKWNGPPHLEIMFKTWLLRDKLESRSTGSRGWSPVDYAPHIWRALNFRLVQLDRDLRMGKTDRLVDVERIHQRLDSLVTAMYSNRPVSSHSGGSETADARIVAAWNAFEKSADKAHWDSANTRHDTTKKRIRTYCDVFYRSFEFVRWYERASVGQSSLSPNDINKLLIDLKSNEAQFNSKVFPANSKVGTLAVLQPMEIAAEDLSVSATKLMEMIGARLEFGAPQESSFLAGAFGDTKTLSRDFRIEVLLDSPLLSAEARKYAYKSPGKKFPEVTLDLGEDLSKVRNQPENQGNSVGWARAKSRLVLYQAMLEMVDISTSFTPPNSSANTKDKIRFYEQAAGIIREHLDDLPQTPGQSTIDTWRAVALLDPRDINSEDRDVISVLPIELTPPLESTILKVNLDSKLELISAKQSVPITLEISASNPAPQTDDLILKLSQADTTEVDLFEFFSIEYEGKRLAKNATINIPFKNLQQLKFDIKTDHHRATDNGSAPFYLIAEVSDVNGSRADSEIQLVPPLPNFVELFARHTETADLIRNRSAASPDFGNIISLRPFPNETHPNNYVFWLANRSGRAKRLHVKLYRVQRPPQLILPPGRVTYYKTQQIPPGLIRHMEKRIEDGLLDTLAEANLTIPATTEVRADYKKVRELENIASISRLLFGPVAPPPSGDPDNPAPKLPAAEPVDSQNGLVCVITELAGESGANDSTGKTWWKWIEVRPRNPADYVEIPVATYDPLDGRIEVTITAKTRADGSPVIDWGAIAEGVPVLWEVDDVQATFESSALKQVLTATQQSVKLFGVLNGKPGPDDVRMVTIPLSVDGYPRTFTLELKCTGAEQQTSTNITPKRKLVRLDDPQFLDETGKPLDPKAVILFPLDKPRADQALTLKECKSIVVSPRIDAPQNSFQYLLPKEGEELSVDRIEAFIEIKNERQQVKTSYADRTFHNMVIHKKGGLEIFSSVADPRFKFDAEGLQDTALEVVTVMHVNGEKIESRKSLLLDSRPPTKGKIYSSSPTSSVEKGAPLTLLLETTDGGTDVANVVFAFNDASISNKTYDPTEMSVGTATKVSENKWSVTIPTKDLSPGSSHRVVARSTDVLGTNFDFHESFLFTVVQSKNDPEMQKKKRFTLLVKLVNPDGSPFRHADKDKCTVSIKGVAQPPTKNGGTFQAKGLPARTYAISASYITQLKSEYLGLREFEIPPETSDEKPIVVNVIMKKK
jgi:hypothetical protein